MKKFFVVLFFACSLLAIADDLSLEDMHRIDSLSNAVRTVQGQIKDAFGKKDYVRVAELNYRAIAMVDSNKSFLEPILGERQLNAIKGYFHYDLACSYSRRHMTEGAFYHLQQAVNYDYSDWKHMFEDHDLDNIRGNARFDGIVENIRDRFDYLSILKKAAPYTLNEHADTLPTFTYQAPDDANLQRVRAYFNLDKVAGNGDEISKIKNIMTYIHNLIEHDGQHPNPEHINAIDMAEACKDGSRGLNCRGLAILLNECYLSMGIPSRYVTCMPREYINDCHVINAVWSNQLGKWLWIDPSFNAWVTDKKGNMLSIQEVRECLRNGTPVEVNKQANWNNREKETTENYLYNYMAKNLYYVIVSLNQEFGLEDSAISNKPHDVKLLPPGYTPDRDSRDGLTTCDDQWFWQAPI